MRIIRQKRPGALSNPTFAAYVATLPGVGAPTSWTRRTDRGKNNKPRKLRNKLVRFFWFMVAVGLSFALLYWLIYIFMD